MKSTAELMLEKICFSCGSKENLTIHHIRKERIHKKRKGQLVGEIILCRECHDIIEDIVIKKRMKKREYERGYKQGLKDAVK